MVMLFKKAGKSTGSNPEKPVLPEIIFQETFFYPAFEIKSCATFAPLKLGLPLKMGFYAHRF
jgi:hypothetical protein